MLDHIGITIPPSRFTEVVDWYLSALAPLNYTKQKDFQGLAIGLGPDKSTIPLWIHAREGVQPTSTHIAFRVSGRETVERFYEEAVKAGGTANGRPGWRHQYHPKYYAGFVVDPVG